MNRSKIALRACGLTEGSRIKIKIKIKIKIRIRIRIRIKIMSKTMTMSKTMRRNRMKSERMISAPPPRTHRVLVGGPAEHPIEQRGLRCRTVILIGVG